MLPLLAGAIAAPIVGGVLGNVLSSGDRSHANDAAFNYLNSVNALSTPDVEKLKATLAQYGNAGNFTPDKESDVLLNSQDAMQNIALDPRLQKTQMDQLEQMQKIGATGGMNPAQQAALNQIRNQGAATQQAKMQQMLEDQARRGTGSSDASMAARLISGQNAANTQSEEADRQAAMAYQNQIAAMAGAGGLASSMQGADYQRQAQLAQALNAREAANVAQRTGTQTRNIDRANTAMQGNVNYARDIAKGNTDIKNQEALQHTGAYEQDYQNRLAKTGLLGNASTGVSNTLNNQANATAGMWSGIGSGIGKGLGGAAMGGLGGSTGGNDVTAQSGLDTPGLRKGYGVVS